MADNLLDKASILLTPTAYNDGSMLSVKPENGDGDFTFSRSSAATRVNAQGLVENVQIISSELVSNGNFSQIGTEEVSNGNFSQEGSELVTNGDFATDSDWSVFDGWSIANGKASNDGTDGYLRQNFNTVNGRIYKVVFIVSDYVSGSARPRLMGGTSVNGDYVSSNGTYTQYITSNGNTNFRLQADDFIGSIDNVSVKEVGQDWTLGTGWSIGEDKASRTAQSGSTSMYQSVSFTANKSYKITYDLDISAGSFLLRIGGGALIDTTPRTTSGTYTEYIVANSGNNVLNLRAVDGNFIGSITNISVKEVGQDWTFGTGWSVGDDKASCDGSQSSQSNLYQAGIVPINNTYKVTFDIVVTSGSIILAIGGSNAQPTVSSSGTYTFTSKATTGDSNLYFSTNSNFIGSITNISVKEITDDTDLPRINYEGFSYQDSLGSEEVVNGSFDTDSDWTKGANWTIANGSANSNGSGLIYQTSVSYVDGKTYKVTFDANITSGGGTVRLGNTTSTIAFTNGANEFYLQTDASNTTRYIFFQGISLVGSIDNVSVKEVLGQEVVPNSGCGSWLLEGQSTNLITQSELFSDSSWTKSSGVTITSKQAISPDGNNNGWKFEKTAVSYRSIGQSYTSSSETTFSIFAKKGTLSVITLFANISGGSNLYQRFDLENGIVDAGSGMSSNKIEDYGNGWYRCSSTFTNTNVIDLAYFPDFGEANAGYLYIYGAQLENQSFNTSYIPTSGATSTRLQDIANNSGNSTLINSTEGVLYYEASYIDGSDYNSISISNNSGSEKLRTWYDNTNLVFANFVNNVNQTFIAYPISKNINYKIAVRYKLNDFALYVNGTKATNIVVNLGGVSPQNSYNKLNFNSGDIYNNFYGKNKALAVYKEALTDAQLQSLTTI